MAGKENVRQGKLGVVRSTFVIDENGVIEKVYPKAKPDTNAMKKFWHI